MAPNASGLQRRHLLQGLAAALAGPGLASLSTHAEARPARAADFATAAAGQPLLAPFQGVSDNSGDLDCADLMLRGRWPAELRGRFYRNGPALYERAGERYHHWFDGDGMVQQYTLHGGRVSHRGRLVRTAKLNSERAAGRFVWPALGTWVENSPPAGGPDAYNTANTNALEHGGRVLALWEGGSAYAMDVQDLATQGPVTWRADLKQVPFSAHPKVDAAGHLWNFGTFGPSIVAWHVDPQGRLAQVQVGESPLPGGMVHDMAVTERYLVIPLPPVTLNFAQPVPEGPRRFALMKGEPLRVLVLDKADITRRRVFELPPQLVFHVGNAHETRDGQIVLSWIGAPDAWVLDQGATGLMSGHPQGRGDVTLWQGRFDLATGKVNVQALAQSLEFPRVHPARVGQAARFLVTGASWVDYPSRARLPLFHGVQVTDVDTGRARRFDYGEHVVVEEHVVVPKPGKSGELDAWLLGSTYDARRRATVLNLLDAAHVEDGPVAQAVLPYTLPLGFHGNFHAA